MKMKEFRPEGGEHVPDAPLDPLMLDDMKDDRLRQS